MSFGLTNMSEMLKYADQEVKDMAAEKRIKRRKDFESDVKSKVPKLDQDQTLVHYLL